MPKHNANESWLDLDAPIERNPASPKIERKKADLKFNPHHQDVTRFLYGIQNFRIDEIRQMNVRDERETFVSIDDVLPSRNIDTPEKAARWGKTKWSQGGTNANPLVGLKPKNTAAAGLDRLKIYTDQKKPKLVLEAIPNARKTRWEIALENFGGIQVFAVARKTKHGKWYAFVAYQDDQSYRTVKHLMSSDCSSAQQAFNRMFAVRRWFRYNGTWENFYFPYASVCITGFGHRTLPDEYVSFTYRGHIKNGDWAWTVEKPEFMPMRQPVPQSIARLHTPYVFSPEQKQWLAANPKDTRPLSLALYETDPDIVTKAENTFYV